MGSFVQQLPALLGIVIGAMASYVVGNAAAKAHWRREQSTRWDKPRADAYVDYGHAVKHMARVAHRICAARALGPKVQPLDPDVGIELLAAADAERSMKWERVLLLGDDQTVEAGNAYHMLVWRLEQVARGNEAPFDDWEALLGFRSETPARPSTGPRGAISAYVTPKASGRLFG
jgi:hypothetical protein